MVQELVAGIDEAGRGPLAGPVVAAAVILPHSYTNPRIRDSKQLTPLQREVLYEEIKKVSLAYAIVAVGPRRIEKLNILAATKLAMLLAVNRLSKAVRPTRLLVDGPITLETEIPHTGVIKGDQIHPQISAASILAKVWRDSLMGKIGGRYPGYSFEVHSGYPTPAHRRALEDLGPCRAHRATFKGATLTRGGETAHGGGSQ